MVHAQITFEARCRSNTGTLRRMKAWRLQQNKADKKYSEASNDGLGWEMHREWSLTFWQSGH